MLFLSILFMITSIQVLCLASLVDIHFRDFVSQNKIQSTARGHTPPAPTHKDTALPKKCGTLCLKIMSVVSHFRLPITTQVVQVREKRTSNI